MSKKESIAYEQLEKLAKETVLTCLSQLGYQAEVVIEGSKKEKVTISEYQKYEALFQELQQSQLWCDIRAMAVENELDEVQVFEQMLKHTFDNMKEDPVAPHIIESIKLCRVVKCEINLDWEKKYKEWMEERFDRIFEKLSEYDAKLVQLDRISDLEELIRKDGTPDLQELLQEKYLALKALFKEYRKISIEDSILYAMACLDKTDIETIILPAFDCVHERMNSKRENGIVATVEIEETEIGNLLFVKVKEKFSCIGIDFTDEYVKKAPLCKLLNRVKGMQQIFYRGEINQKFAEMITCAEKELYIMSPWANEFVYGKYISLFKAAVRRGVKIHVAYGYKYNEKSNASGGERGRSESEENTRSRMRIYHEELSKEAGEEAITLYHGDSHIKGAIIDNRYMILGSCNLLSAYPEDNDTSPFSHGEMMMSCFDTEAMEAVKKRCFYNKIRVKSTKDI